MNIYLDVVGTLVDQNGMPASHVNEFLKVATKKHHPYWLTSLAKDGNTSQLLKYLKSAGFIEETMRYVDKVVPQTWDAHKSTGIYFDEPFVWFDNAPDAPDLHALEKAGVIDSLYLIDLINDPEALAKATAFLEEHA